MKPEIIEQLQELCYILHCRNLLNGRRMSACSKVNYYRRIKTNLEIHNIDTPEVRERKRTMKWAKNMPPAEHERCERELSDSLARAYSRKKGEYHKVPKKWQNVGYRELNTLVLQWKAEYAKLKYETALFTTETNDKVRKLAAECNMQVCYDNGYVYGLQERGKMLQTVAFHNRDFIKKQHDSYVANQAVHRMLSDEETQ